MLVPVATLLGMLAVVSSHRESGPVRVVANGLLTIMGVVVVTFSTWELVTNWSQFELWRNARPFALPLWLSMGLVPYLYLMSLLAGYESAFLRVAFASPNRKISTQSQLALFSVLHIRARPVAGFRAPWIGRLAEAPTLTEARCVVKDYLSHFRRPIAAGNSLWSP
jgi:hypothetical protein